MSVDCPPLDDGMVIYATRYVLGRKSYAVGEVVDYLVAHWDKLEHKTQVVISADIRHAVRLGKTGMEMDKRQWERVLARAGHG